MALRFQQGQTSSIACRFIETKTFDQAEIISEMLRKMARTPGSSEWKTIACLARGTVLPYTLAVSGYSDGPFGSHDGALDRPTWTQKVFQWRTADDSNQ
jgi:hypothetical protein